MKSKRLISKLFAKTAMTLALVVLTATTAWASTFSGGSGTADDPYKIANYSDLQQLAPDPEPSAPGDEPVVTPQRIVSTDKKALQLGGRQVALDGQPVRPTDEVNVAKKYQLIALE